MGRKIGREKCEPSDISILIIRLSTVIPYLGPFLLPKWMNGDTSDCDYYALAKWQCELFNGKNRITWVVNLWREMERMNCSLYTARVYTFIYLFAQKTNCQTWRIHSLLLTN